MLVSSYNNIIVLPNCTMRYYVFSGRLTLRAYMPEIKFNKIICSKHRIMYIVYDLLRSSTMTLVLQVQLQGQRDFFQHNLMYIMQHR